jgi:hypothetical protein
LIFKTDPIDFHNRRRIYRTRHLHHRRGRGHLRHIALLLRIPGVLLSALGRHLPLYRACYRLRKGIDGQVAPVNAGLTAHGLVDGCGDDALREVGHEVIAEAMGGTKRPCKALEGGAASHILRQRRSNGADGHALPVKLLLQPGGHAYALGEGLGCRARDARVGSYTPI